MKRISFVLLLIILFITGCSKENSNKLTIVTTNFPSYDFVRAIVKDNVEVKMLLKPGVETHDYEPTPKDIIDIKNSDLFVYIGGESDYWVDNILKDIDKDSNKVIKLMDYVDLVEEDTEEDEHEHEEEDEYDEHIWTSPINAIKIIEGLRDKIISIDNNEEYLKNSNEYIDEIKKIDFEIRELVSNSKRKTLVFADRFPILYFVKEYGLSYYAAFPGCAHETEVSAKTLSFLIDKVKEESIPVVFHIELSNTKIADAISSETNTKVLEYHTGHNISKSDFIHGVTYVDIMKNNIKVLKEALN